MRFARVALNIPSRKLGTLWYSLPPDARAGEGQAVWAPCGDDLVQGIIFEIRDSPPRPGLEIKPIAEFLSESSLLPPHGLELARWLVRDYLCTPFQAVSLMLPPGFERRMLNLARYITTPPKSVLASLSPLLLEIFRFIRRRKEVEIEEIRRRWPQAKVEEALKQLGEMGLIETLRRPEAPRVKPKYAQALKLALPPEEAQKLLAEMERRAPARRKLLSLLLQDPSRPFTFGELERDLGISRKTIRSLIEAGIAREEKIRISRLPLKSEEKPLPLPPLSPEEEEELEEVRKALRRAKERRGEIFLLLGGRERRIAFYLKALREAVKLGRKALILVPEIILIPDLWERISKLFPGRAALLHSGLSQGAQFDEWHRIYSGEVDVVVGSRSAIFAPLSNLSLVIVDEEQDAAYKQQEMDPRYNARDVALKLSELVGAVVILGSSSPDVETFWKAQRGLFKLLRLPSRNSPRPEIRVVDMRRELREGWRGILSRPLLSEMRRALDEGGQVVLFLNRRGMAPFMQCLNCGFVLRCRRCDLPLTFHADIKKGVCHQCNWQAVPPERCPRCDKGEISFIGFGTERVEEEARKLFPDARILRWDRDAVPDTRTYRKLLAELKGRKVDILIGTQMIARGFRFPEARVLGVVNADIGLYFPDFRAGERIYQLIRELIEEMEGGGKVFIQTFSPEHYCIKALGEDYLSFFREEIAHRAELHNPPFTRIARLIFHHTNERRCREEAERMAELLRRRKEERGYHDLSVVGPSPAFFRRVRGRYRWQIFVRGPRPQKLLWGVFFPEGWIIDMDPVNLL